MMRLVVIALLYVMDNSETERDFSLLNDLKTSFQHAMAHDVTQARMWWYKMKKDMTAARWGEAVERIGRQWLKAEETKSGKRRAHEAATTAATVIASAAASAPQT